LADPDDRIDLSPVPDPSAAKTDVPLGETRNVAGSGRPSAQVRQETNAGLPNAGSSNAGLPNSGSPSADDRMAALGQSLIELQIISEQQWNEALARAGTISDIEAVLDALRHMPSLRKYRLEPNLPALSAYQASLIREGRIRDLRLGSYLFIDRVGAGGMGEVFKAWNLNLDRIEAIKLVTHADITGSTIGMARFDREARVLAQLNHPCITTIYNTGREGNAAYIAMEFVHGRTLLDVVRDAKRKEEKVPEAWALDAMKEVASALEHAHQLGIIHRDIKPNNIMITQGGEVRVLDMGIARLLDPAASQSHSNLTRQVAGLGTPEVMPPEQWADASSVSPASDIYSLGCTLYYLLAGHMPFWSDTLHGLMSAHLTQAPESLRTARPELSPFVDQLIHRMLAKDPRDRFQTCSELLDAIQRGKLDVPRAQAAERPSPTRPREMPTARPASTRAWVLLAGLILVAGVTAGGAYYLVHFQKNYSQQKEVWITSFQSANVDTWPTIDSLHAVLQKENPPKVSDDETFEEFKQWLKVRSEDQSRHRREFLTWAQSLQERKNKIWRTPDELLAYCKADLSTVSSKDDLDTIRRMVENETSRREAIRAKARVLLTSLETENKDVFAGPAELEAIASKVVPIDELTDEKDLDRIKEAIEVAAKKKFEGRVESELAHLQTDFVDVWKNTDAIKNHLGQKGGAPGAVTGNLEKMRSEVLHETWRRRAHYWLTDYQEDRVAIWKSAAELVAFVDQAFPTDIEDESAYQKMQQAVRMETKQRWKTTLAQWSGEFAGEYPELGPAIDPEKTTFPPGAEDSFTRADGKEAFEETLLDQARSRIAKASLAPTGNPQADFQNDHLLKLVCWLAGLSDDDSEPTGELELTIEMNGKEIQAVPLQTKATLTATSTVPGFVTVIVLESTGRVFVFQWDEPLPANKKINVVRFDSTSEGEDQILCFVTSVNPRLQLPAVPANLGIKPVAVPPGYLEKFVFPPILTEKADIERIRSALPTPAVWDELIDSLGDEPSPGYGTQIEEVGEWAKSSINVKWVGTK
jgi:hypothetical protein